MDEGPSNPLNPNEAELLVQEGLNPAEWFTTRTLSQYWDIPRGTVRIAAWQGRIAGALKIGNHWYYNKEQVLAGWRPREVMQREEVDEDGYAVRGRGVELLKEVEGRFLASLAEAVTPEDWLAIITTAVEQAIEGEWRARKWLSDYLLGVPVHRVAAEVDVRGSGGFTESERAAALATLLDAVVHRAEDEGEIIDVTPTRNTGQVNPYGAPAGRQLTE